MVVSICKSDDDGPEQQHKKELPTRRRNIKWRRWCIFLVLFILVIFYIDCVLHSLHHLWLSNPISKSNQQSAINFNLCFCIWWWSRWWSPARTIFLIEMQHRPIDGKMNRLTIWSSFQVVFTFRMKRSWSFSSDDGDYSEAQDKAVGHSQATRLIYRSDFPPIYPTRKFDTEHSNETRNTRCRPLIFSVGIWFHTTIHVHLNQHTWSQLHRFW